MYMYMNMYVSQTVAPPPPPLGRRQVHTRLVEPSIASMNSGDVYICISGKSLYHWVGKSANVIEKARVSGGRGGGGEGEGRGRRRRGGGEGEERGCVVCCLPVCLLPCLPAYLVSACLPIS